MIDSCGSADGCEISGIFAPAPASGAIAIGAIAGFASTGAALAVAILSSDGSVSMPAGSVPFDSVVTIRLLSTKYLRAAA